MKNQLTEDFIEHQFFENGSSDESFKYKDQDSIDPLDSYMLNLEQQKDIKRNKEIVMETDDPLEGYLDAKKKQILKNRDQLDFEKIKKFRKNIIPLENIDHNLIQYQQFNKSFYQEHEEIANMTLEQSQKILKEFDIKIKGKFEIKPIVSFAHLGFDQQMIDLIQKKQFEKPTQIQCIALPLAMSGHDIIGIAKTGSGKTYAYVWPLLVHILDQPQLEKNEGPIGVILAPTRELTQQIYLEVKLFAKLYDISCAALLGGESKHEQWKNLKAGVEILICTPGRLIEMIKKKATNFQRTTYVVLDEADKMFQMGFEPQVRSILNQIRPDRQTLFFSATFKKNLQSFAADCLNSPVVITIGKDKQSNENIQQQAFIFQNEETKLQWLYQSLENILKTGKVILFVNQIKNVVNLEQEIEKRTKIKILTLHGDKLQQDRTQIINDFKNKGTLLIATDVASRGLDIKEVSCVINVDVPKDLDTHIHRIGRTGRGDNKGMAYSLLTLEDISFAVQLCKNFEISGQEVPKDLLELALCDDAFKRKMKQKEMGFKNNQKVLKLCQNAMKRGQKDSKGLGYKEQGLNDQIKKQASSMISNNSFKQIFEQSNEIQQDNNQNYKQIFDQPTKIQQNNQQYQKPEEIQQKIDYDIQQNQEKKQYVRPVQQSREEIRSELMGVFKSQMQNSFRSNFVSKGEIQIQKGAPQILFRKSEDADKFQEVQTKMKQQQELNLQYQQKIKERSRSREIQQKRRRSSSSSSSFKKKRKSKKYY